MGKKIVIGITAASGAIYAKRLLFYLEKYHTQWEEVAVVFSENAEKLWELEIGEKPEVPFKTYANNDFMAPFASGSAAFRDMIICPCTMGSMGKIANGLAIDLISRAADVVLKERGNLVLVSREMPLNAIHIENMRKITAANGIICPASPSFYHKPQSIEEMVDTVVFRALELIHIQTEQKNWGD
jgi:4-hydroxy-3-polyprenylbenzoate decarboxylase